MILWPASQWRRAAEDIVSGAIVDFHGYASGAKSMRIIRKWLPALYPSAFHYLQAHVFGFPRNVCLGIVGFHLQQLSFTYLFHFVFGKWLSCPCIHCPIRVSCWHDVHDMGNWRCLVQGWLSSDDLRRWIQQVSVERVILQCFQVSLCWSPFASLFLAAGFLWRSCTGTAMWLIPSISLEPHLPRKVKVDVTTCHACHAECTSMWQSAMPARRIHVEVAKRHACHANSRDNHKTQARHQSQPSPISATPATQSEGRCHQMRVSCVCVRELCVCVHVSKLCVSKLCVSKLSVNKLCACVNKLCV